MPSVAGDDFSLASLDLAPGQYVVTGSFIIANEADRRGAWRAGSEHPG
ncbi:MAG: hypothetical protein M3116_01165 [Actinomycetota bacterium]|nr:hypothetical protein [Actinomycetota bacterium]